jgi:hypothetical protein
LTPLFVSVNTVPSNTPATGLKRFRVQADT